MRIFKLYEELLFMWILLVCIYGVIKGARDIIKKKAMTKSSAIEVLFIYTLLSFLFVTPDINSALKMDMVHMPFIILKSFIIFIGWICGFKAIKKMPVSLYGVLDMSRVVFAVLLGVIILGESFTVTRVLGMILVLIGLLLVNIKNKNTDREKVNTKALIMVIICCLCNASSEILDKFLMKSVTSSELQFWYMFYLALFYFLYIIITRTKIKWKSVCKNYWILILAILFVIGDRALFIACSYENSTVIAITLIKQCSVLVTIIGGKLVFKEEKILQRMICASIIICGIFIGVM